MRRPRRAPRRGRRGAPPPPRPRPRPCGSTPRPRPVRPPPRPRPARPPPRLGGGARVGQLAAPARAPRPAAAASRAPSLVPPPFGIPVSSSSVRGHRSSGRIVPSSSSGPASPLVGGRAHPWPRRAGPRSRGARVEVGGGGDRLLARPRRLALERAHARAPRPTRPPPRLARRAAAPRGLARLEHPQPHGVARARDLGRAHPQLQSRARRRAAAAAASASASAARWCSSRGGASPAPPPARPARRARPTKPLDALLELRAAQLQARRAPAAPPRPPAPGPARPPRPGGRAAQPARRGR